MKKYQTGPRGGIYYMSQGRRRYVNKNNLGESTPISKVVGSNSKGNTSAVESESKEDWIKKNTQETPQQKKYCRCLLEVAAKQTDKCLTSGTKGTKGCPEPHAICARSTGTSTGRTPCDHDFDSMPNEYLIAFLELHGKPVPKSLDRSSLLSAVKQYK